MSSRRRPALRSSTLDEFSPAANDQGAPSDRQSAASRVLREVRAAADAISSRKDVIDGRFPLHPAATDYGPDTFKAFMDCEGKNLKDLGSNYRILEEQHDEYLRGLLRTLSEAQSHLNSIKKNRKPDPPSLASDEFSSLSPYLLSDSGTTSNKETKLQLPRLSDSDSFKSRQGTMIHPRSPRSKISKDTKRHAYATQKDTIEEDGDNDVLSVIGFDQHAKLDSMRKEDIDNVNTDSHGPNSKSHSQIPRSEPNSFPESTQLQFDGYSDVITKMHNRPRASSFENHAAQSRHSLRSKSKIPENDSNAAGASLRPRKMSASLHASLNPLLTPFLLDQASQTSLDIADKSAISQSSLTLAIDVPSRGKFYSSTKGVCMDENRHPNSFRHRSWSQTSNDASQTGEMDEVASYSEVTSRNPRLKLNVRTFEPKATAIEIQEQQAIFASLSEKKASKSDGRRKNPDHITKFNYHTIVPEQLLSEHKHDNVSTNFRTQNTRGDEFHGVASIQPALQRTISLLPELIDNRQKSSNVEVNVEDFCRRKHYGPLPTVNLREPPFCPPSATLRSTLPNVIWEEGVLDYLSSSEVRNLRLVCKGIAEDLEQYVFRNVVTRFSPSMFNLNLIPSQPRTLDLNASDSMLRKYGSDINKFGIAFEIDPFGLANAPFKTTETTINAWFGRYQWPVKEYPYFPSLKQIDQILDDDRRFLTQALAKLTGCSELALSLDSGHGWLEGPDISDLALYRRQAEARSPIFGKTFSAPDKYHEDGLKRLFRWAQINTIGENIKHLAPSDRQANDELSRLQSILIRDYSSFRVQTQQPDYERHLHTGGAVADNTQHAVQQAPNQNQTSNDSLPYADIMRYIRDTTIGRRIGQYARNHQSQEASEKSCANATIPSIQPQWPLIFSGFNLASECKGDSTFVQARVASPSSFPLLPGHITEAQAQWMMETVWIQRTFLTAYTDAVRLNIPTLKTVHTLTLAQISSGLLQCLSQEAFWTALPGLRKIKILVKPDWRTEHTPGDKLYSSNMLIDPVKASVKFAEFLRKCIAKLENLYTLHIGYVGGGEHQVGLFGRNQHILPAPITQNPKEWVLAFSGSTSIPSNNTTLVFPHVRNLTFENCWFSPRMLETFMTMSRDTSLHNLSLESVSLTSRINSTRTDGPLQTVRNNLKCSYGPGGWLNEDIPDNAGWVHTLDKITPGLTILDRKYAAHMINEEQIPKAEPEFRGNVQRITLKSCGYVKIKGVSSSDFNQNELVVQNSSWTMMDEGLRARASTGFSKTVFVETPTDNNDSRFGRSAGRLVLSLPTAARPTGRRSTSWIARPEDADASQEQHPATSCKFIMLGGRLGLHTGDAASNFISETNLFHTSLTGTLTQCIHPVEKRILEQCWGIRFGWGDDMKRWEAVEDGWFIGGTGRFSGTVYRDEEDQARAVAKSQTETEHRNSISTSIAPSTGTDISAAFPSEDDSMNDDEPGNIGGTIHPTPSYSHRPTSYPIPTTGTEEDMDDAFSPSDDEYNAYLGSILLDDVNGCGSATAGAGGSSLGQTSTSVQNHPDTQNGNGNAHEENTLEHELAVLSCLIGSARAGP